MGQEVKVKKAVTPDVVRQIVVRTAHGEKRAAIMEALGPDVNLRLVAKTQAASGQTKANAKVVEQDRAIVTQMMIRGGATPQQAASALRAPKVGTTKKAASAKKAAAPRKRTTKAKATASA